VSKLHSLEAGTGEPLVLLHSGGMSSEEWSAHLPRFAAQHRVIAPDAPGHGHSPMRGKTLSLQSLAAAVLEVMDQRGVERAHLCGSSMGGVTALRIALLHPERVRRLIIYRASYRKDPEQLKQTLSMGDPERWRRLGVAPWLSKLHEAQGGPEAWKTVIQRVARAFESNQSDHSLESLAKLQAKTLIVVGDRDPIVPLERALEMHRTIPDAALWVMPSTTHITATNTWRRQAFADEVLRFLRRP